MDTTNDLKGEKPGRKGRKNKGLPETNAPDMSYEKSIRGGRGMSIDMGSPYLLPPELHNSRDSLHSLTRSIHSHEDRYKPATTFVSNDTSSIRSFPSKRGMDDSSIYTGSSGIGLGHQDGMHDELLKNPQRISRSSLPQRGASLARHKNPDSRMNSPTEPMPEMPELAHTLSPKDSPGAPTPPPKSGGLVPPSSGEEPRDSYIEKDGGDMRRSNNYLGTFINTRESSVASEKDTSSRNSPQDLSMPLPPVQHNDDRRSPTPVTLVHPDDANLGRQLSHKAPVIHVSEENHYPGGSGDFSNGFKVTPPSLHRTSDSDYEDPHEQYHDGIGMANGPLEGAEVHDGEDYGGLDAPALGYDLRRLSMGFRPLPPEDPTDDPEQRANRIRSFYKEYFDESKQAQVNEDYFGDYGDDYYEDAAFYDPETGEYIMANAPYMDPIPRRAMTPPPRAPPRFQGAARHGPSMSSGFLPPGPRAYSSQSGRMPGGLGGPGGRRPPPKKRLPPPSPLRNLPTPHLLKEDSFALPIDFAPPRTYKERREGRPESPVVGLRPYSPALPAHLPLASSFDDLAMMPSPYVSLSKLIIVNANSCPAMLYESPVHLPRSTSRPHHASEMPTPVAMLVASGAIGVQCRPHTFKTFEPAHIASAACQNRPSAPRSTSWPN